jgi:hypothetical protein
MTELKRLSSEENVPSQTVAPVMPVSSGEAKPNMILRTLLVVVILSLGVGSGYVAHAYGPGKGGNTTEGSMRDKKINSSAMKVGDVFGVKDTSDEFTDTAEGILDKGGSKGGEGSHKLIRPGGDDQTAYLNSSVVDLDQFVGHKVKIWGKTFAAQKAGWLLDVGKVQILELNAQSPTQNE